MTRHSSREVTNTSRGSTARSAYRKLGLLGSGAYGVVYRAERHNDVTARVFALKIARHDPLLRNKAEYYARLECAKRERHILRKAHHHHIVKMFGSYATETEHVYELQFEMGGTLSGLIRKQYGSGLEEDTVKDFARQILGGLQHLHSLKIAHRDLKPANILLDEHQSILKLADFGLACQFSGPDGTSATSSARSSPLLYDFTTEPYAAPESLTPEKTYIPASIDIWSWACIVYEMSSGQVPFKDWRFGLNSHQKKGSILLQMERISGLPKNLTFRKNWKAMVKRAPLQVPASADFQELPKQILAVLVKSFRPDPADRPDALTLLEDDCFLADAETLPFRPRQTSQPDPTNSPHIVQRRQESID